MDTLSSLVFQLGKKVAVAIPMALSRCSYYSVDCFQPSSFWLHMNSISATPNPLSLYYFLPDCWCHSLFGGGGCCLWDWMRSHLPLLLFLNFFLPYPSTLVSFSGLTTSPCAATSGNKCEEEAFDLRHTVVRYKCRIVNYLACGEGREVAGLDHIIKLTCTLLFTVLVFSLICSTRFSSPWLTKWCWSTGSTTSVMTYLYVALLR